MTSEELREACEMAGFVRMRGKDGPYYVVAGNPFEDGGAWQLHEHHPALPAYVASVLGNIIAREGHDDLEFLKLIVKSANQHGHEHVTDSDRIRAAMAVLRQYADIDV